MADIINKLNLLRHAGSVDEPIYVKPDVTLVTRRREHKLPIRIEPANTTIQSSKNSINSLLTLFFPSNHSILQIVGVISSNCGVHRLRTGSNPCLMLSKFIIWYRRNHLIGYLNI